MMKAIKRWYEGETKLMEFKNESDSSVIATPLIYTEYHWTAKVVRTLVGFYLRHWKWLWCTAIAIVGLYITFSK